MAPRTPEELIEHLQEVVHRESRDPDMTDDESRAAYEDLPVTWDEMREIVSLLAEAAAALTEALKELAEAQANNARSVCVWCGTIMPFPNGPDTTSEERVRVMWEHAEGCDKRPEKRLADALEAAEAERDNWKARAEAAELHMRYASSALTDDRADLDRLTNENRRLRHERDAADCERQPGVYECRTDRACRACQLRAEQDQLREIVARYENAQCIACATHLDAALSGGDHEGEGK